MLYVRQCLYCSADLHGLSGCCQKQGHDPGPFSLEKFVPLENLRDTHSPIRVLHEAVRFAGIAETGPMMPLLSNINDPTVCEEIEAAAIALFEANASL